MTRESQPTSHPATYPGYKPQPTRENFTQQEARLAHNLEAERAHLKTQLRTSQDALRKITLKLSTKSGDLVEHIFDIADHALIR